MTTWPILSVVTFLPLVGALVIYLNRGDDEAAHRLEVEDGRVEEELLHRRQGGGLVDPHREPTLVAHEEPRAVGREGQRHRVDARGRGVGLARLDAGVLG